MTELTVAEAKDLIDSWTGVLREIPWPVAGSLPDRTPKSVLMSITAADAKAAVDEATIIGWFETEQRLHLDLVDEVFTLYPGAP